MYKLTILQPDLSILQYGKNPFTGTMPDLVEMLSEILDANQSYSTILASVNEKGSYARSALDQVGLPCIVVIAPVANEVSGQ